MDPWMQENQDEPLELGRHAREALGRFKASPVRTTGTVLARTIKLSFTVAVGATLAALKLAALTATSSREEEEEDTGASQMPIGGWYDVNTGKYVSVPTRSSIYVED